MHRAFFISLLLTILCSLSALAATPVPKLKPGTEVKATPVRSSGVRNFKGTTPVPVLKPKLAAKIVKKPVIVIDPGHGGTDPGAIGAKGTYEKNITTAAANELAARLRKSGKYKVIVTRSKDNHVDHDERLRIARTGQADLFISIHADSTGNKNVRGASVYTLADRAKGRSKRIVNNQNWILDVDLSEQSDPVGDILVDLAQRKTESQSDAFAKILLSELRGKTVLVTNSHRRAGYYVLLAPDVPAVLLELGFLSNVQDEKLLRTQAHRTKILSGVERAIDTYMAQN